MDSIDPSLELSRIEQSFARFGEWFNELIIELGESDHTPETLKKDAEFLLPKLDQSERRLNALGYQAHQLVWEFLPAEDVHFNCLIIHRLKHHKELILANGIRPLREFFATS